MKDNFDIFSDGWVAGRKDLLEQLENSLKADLHDSIDWFIKGEMEKIKKELKNKKPSLPQELSSSKRE